MKKVKDIKDMEVLEELALPLQAWHTVWIYWQSKEEYSRWRTVFLEDLALFIKRWKEQDHYEERALGFYLRLAKESPAREKLPWDYFVASMKDISIWCMDYHRKTGKYGIEQLDWIGEILLGRVIRMGRLQFQEDVLREDLGELKKGDRVLQVHIPEDGPLYPKECSLSFALARKFYQEDLPFVCESWLLSPCLHQLLDEKSNILQFQKRFLVVKEDLEIPQAEERIFGMVLQEKEYYPQKTSLQKRAKKYLLQGKKIGYSYGYFL